MGYHKIMTIYHQRMADFHDPLERHRMDLPKAKMHASLAAYHALRDGNLGLFKSMEAKSSRLTERIKEDRHERVARIGEHKIDDYELASWLRGPGSK